MIWDGKDNLLFWSLPNEKRKKLAINCVFRLKRCHGRQKRYRRASSSTQLDSSEGVSHQFSSRASSLTSHILLSFSQIAPNIELGWNPHSSFWVRWHSLHYHPAYRKLFFNKSCLHIMIFKHFSNFFFGPLHNFQQM